MDPATWKRARDLVEAALELPAEERRAFVGSGSGGEAELLEAALGLLAEVEVPETKEPWPRPPDLAVGLGSGGAGPGEDAPTEVGGWVLSERIGSGGMGTVYRGRRTAAGIEQVAAIKLLKRGLDTDELLARFRREGQLLARLEHPGIARLIDGGASADGRPFLAMEFVEGEHIHRWCDGRELSVRERIKLFREVCTAVGFAHANLVVHRDLKPSNILVGSDGRPRLLDFGVAKVLRDEGEPRVADVLITDTERPVPLTPEYASPEQVRGDPVTTATDVYSLGAVLYQLLTGQRAHRFATRSPKEVERSICERRPPEPSSAVIGAPTDPGTADSTTTARARGTSPKGLAKLLSGDLDLIVMKALHKVPERRYASVEQFSADLGRFLAGEPIAARPDSIAYRAERFFARHRSGVLGSALLVALAGLGWWNSRRLESDITVARAAEEDQRNLSAERSAELRSLARDVLGQVAAELKELPGSLELRARIVADASERLDGLLIDERDPAPLMELVNAYLNLGAMQGGQTSASLGQYEMAEQTLEKVDGLLVRLDQVEPDAGVPDAAVPDAAMPDAAMNWRWEKSLDGLRVRRHWLAGLLADHAGRSEEALELMGRAAELALPGSSHWRSVRSDLGLRLAEAGRSEESLEFLGATTKAMREIVVAESESSAADRYRLGRSLFDEGHVLRNMQVFGPAEERLLEAQQLFAGLLEEEPRNTDYLMSQAGVEQRLGILMTQTGRSDGGAEPLLKSAVAVLEQLVEANPRWLMPRDDLIGALFNLGEHAILSGQNELGLEFHTRGEAACLERLAIASSATGERQLAAARDRMGAALNLLGRFDEARDVLEQAKRFFVARAAQSDSASDQRDLAVCCYILGSNARLQANGTPPPEGYVENLERAYDEWDQCVDILLELDRKGQMMERDRGQLEHLQEQLLDIEERLIAAEAQ